MFIYLFVYIYIYTYTFTYAAPADLVRVVRREGEGAGDDNLAYTSTDV